MKSSFDMIVIGAGAGGLTTAITGASTGKSVLLIEKNKPGGECTWSGCVPSKALINIAKEVHVAKKYADFEIDTKKALEGVREVIAKVYEHETPEVLEGYGITYLQGAGKFVGPNEVRVDDSIYEGKKIIISTGSSPFVPPIEGIDTVDYLTNESIFVQEKLPESMIVLGGGAIGVEIAQASNRLGVKVDLVEMMDNILIREDQELAVMLREKLVEEGVGIHVGTKAVKVEKDGEDIKLTVEKDGKTTELKAKGLLVAVGRKANLDNLGLEEAGVEYTPRSITVNKHMQTSNANVYAVGDVVGPYQFSHMANFQGIAASLDIIVPVKRSSMDYSHVAWCTFTEPELASAGMTEEQAREKDENVTVYRFSGNDIDRAKTKKGDVFEVKVICDAKKHILGCQILADRAGELICEIQAMKANNITIDKLANVIHPYPTYGEIFNKIGKKARIDKFQANPVVHLAQALKKK